MNQSNLTISIQGNRGSYSHIAAKHLFGENIALLERDSFKEVFEDAKSERADFAVIPIENSTHGSVFQNYDLMSDNNFFIIKELYLKVNFHLIANPESTFENITDLYTHPVAISQIKNFLNQNPQITAHEFPDNGGAVAMVKEKKLTNSAGAASKLAAEIYGMKILKENIHDNPKNYTRFFVLSKNAEYEENANKTSIQFEVKHQPGTLVSALKAFSDQGISLMKIESRPILATEWEYKFYVDMLAGVNEERMQKALEDLQEATTNLRILGTYRVGEYIET